jgi:CPA2 family monovalent cation:H+ antiporter-2
MHGLALILTLTGGLAAALVLGYVTQRLGLSPIVGYLLAGIAVGPHTPGFVADRGLAEPLAEIGVILLLFGVGLHFHLEQLWAVRRVAILGAVGRIALVTALGAAVTRAFGWSWAGSIVFGLAISVASTVVLVRVLTDNRALHTPTGHIAVGWVIVEDLFTVMALVMLPTLFGNQPDGATAVLATLVVTALKIAALVAFTVFVGGRVIPWLLEHVSRTRSRELFNLTVLVLALGIAVGSATLFGVSMALGAFLAGTVVGRSEFSLRAASEVLPMRDAFAVLFFVSVGMLFDPGHLVESPWLVAATLAVILLGKTLGTVALVFLLGYPLRVGLSVAVALAQIGEFSFILALVGNQLGVLPASAMNTLVAAAIVSITLNPLLYRLVEPAVSRLSGPGRPSFEASPRLPDGNPRPPSRHRAVVVGYGPVGRTVTRLLRENDIEPTVVELNLATVRRLREEGVPAVYGDASDGGTLRSAGVPEAASLILSASGLGGEEIVRRARELNPAIQVLARSTYVREIPALRKVGAEVFSGEGEVALALTVALLEGLGATPEQIARERERVHAELLGAGDGPAEPPSRS